MSFPEGTNALEEPLPCFGGWALASADTMCQRRLHEDFSSSARTKEPFNSGRIRSAVIDAIRTFHEAGTMPAAPGHLEPEERAVVDHALGWYPRLFDRDGAIRVDLPLEPTTELPRRGVRLSGLVDLCTVEVANPDEPGRKELRQLAFGARRVPDDPLDLPGNRLAVLRLAQERWVQDEPLSLVWVDLLSGARVQTIVRVPDDLTPLGSWLDERLDVVRARMDAGAPTAGRDCTTCRYVPRCPVHDLRGAMTTKRSDMVPGVLTLSPTGLDTWARCRREWRNHVLLRLPPSDPVGGTDHGLYLHNILRFIHEDGTCRDEERVTDVLTSHGADERVVEEVRRHVTKCPIDATSVGHEVEWVRTNPVPPVFLASARLDAIWRSADGDVLEIRDYKTGQRLYDSIADDPRAQLQAWVAAPFAAREGLRLRIRYEHLAREVNEDPEPWEPDEEDLARIDQQLREIVTEMRAEHTWAGVNDATFCRYCRYRSICPDSATPTEPAWASVADLGDEALDAEESG